MYDDNWYEYNDSSVSSINIDDKKYNTKGSDEPYLLFYIKR